MSQIGDTNNGNRHYQEGAEFIYTSGPRYLEADEETSCIRCGHDAEKARALHLPAPTMPKPGYIHCLLCSPNEVYRAADHNPTHAEERAREHADILEVFYSETRRGIKGGGGGGNGRRREKKPGEKMILRPEQDWHGFAPTHDARAIIIKVQNADVELNLRVPTILTDELRNASEHRRVSKAMVLREALADTLPSLPRIINGVERGTHRSKLHHFVTPGEKGMLDREAADRKVSLNDLFAEVLTVHFYRNP
jgi:hypothetical protein